MKYFSLFSGIGGFEHGIEKADRNSNRQGSLQKTNITENKNSKCHSVSKSSQSSISRDYACVGYSEIDKYAKAIYRYHYPEHKDYGNATKIVSGELPDFDLLVGGFPCQSFSIAGKRKGMSGEDIRGTLFFEIWRIARDKRPRTLLLENVPGLLSSQGGKDFQTILRSLDEIRYDVEWDCLNSKNFGVPQNRERVFIIGYLRGQGFKKIFPLKESNQTNYTMEQSRKSISKCLRARGQEGHSGMMLINETYIDDMHSEQFRSLLYNLSPALKASRSKGYALPKRVRRLTPTECERLQAFPDGWTKYGIVNGKKVKISDTQRYKCLGNAVTTNVIQAIIESLFEEIL
jgi:DNA-cytosine methyltransferase